MQLIHPFIRPLRCSGQPHASHRAFNAGWLRLPRAQPRHHRVGPLDVGVLSRDELPVPTKRQ